MVFERIQMFTEEIETAREERRPTVLPGDVRERRQYTGVATQHRIFAALRVFLNHQWKRQHKIPFNPVYAIELEPETRAAALVWTPAQIAHFLEHTADDRLHFLWRLALVRGSTKIVSEQLGHPTTRITEDLYQHVRVQLQIDAAEQAVALLPGTKPEKRTGS